MKLRDKAFNEFIGPQVIEADAGWSQEVWNAAWNAAFDAIDKYSEGHDRQWREYALEIIDEVK